MDLIYLTLIVVHSVLLFVSCPVSIFWFVVAVSFNAAYIGNPKPTGFVGPPVFGVARSVAIESFVYLTRVLHTLHFLIEFVLSLRRHERNLLVPASLELLLNWGNVIHLVPD